jgi:hypothetical protein
VIRLTKNTANTVVVTLEENRSISNAYYLFEFKNNQTGVKSYCIPDNISTEVQRYDEFVITETSSPVALNGEVELDEGEYTYTVYEQASSTNLNPSGLTSVEMGLCKVFDSSNNTNTEYSGASTTNTVYEG